MADDEWRQQWAYNEWREAGLRSVSSKHYYNLLKNQFFSLWVVEKPVRFLFKSLSIVKVWAIRFNDYNQTIKIFNTFQRFALAVITAVLPLKRLRSNVWNYLLPVQMDD